MRRIFIAGHKGMVGSAIQRELTIDSNSHIITADQKEIDLTNQQAVSDFFTQQKIDQVYLAAAKVGGIHANTTYPADFIYQNLMIQNNIIHSSYRSGVVKLLFLGSSCIYPKLAVQPMPEGELLSGYLEPTNEPYALAKIAGIKMCESYNRQYGVDYRSVMPTNLYGAGDNYHSENSHVIPALIRRFHEAKEKNAAEVEVWGTGSVLREFLHVDDMARAAVHVMNLDEEIYKTKTFPMLSHFNVGSGIDFSIKELTEKIAEVIGFSGKIRWDISKSDGAPRKLMDSSLLISTGWRPKIKLQHGLSQTYAWFLDNLELARK